VRLKASDGSITTQLSQRVTTSSLLAVGVLRLFTHLKTFLSGAARIVRRA